jgi:glycosyltransferase involved in cell wall biosynthesis
MTFPARPTISCVVPVWNGEAYLQEALDSIFAQTLPPLEILVIDDGSTDRSAAIAERHADRVTLIRQPHRGISATRNIGIARATGDLIALLDADDLWLESKLARQVAALAAEPGVECCYTLIETFAQPGSGAAIPAGLQVDRVGRIASTFLGTRGALDRVGPIDEARRIRAEFAWFARFDDLGIKSVVVPERLARRRLHDTNNSLIDAGEAVDAAFDLIARRLNRASSAL